jgi:hypothetical protein
MPNLNTQITPPRVPLTDERTGAVSREWYRWFYNIYNITGGALGITPVVNGGTGLGTIPTNGQLLIGNGTGYTLNTLGTGAGISVTNGLGTITVANTGVLSFAGGTTGLTPAAATTGAVTLAGILIAANGGTGFGSYAIGDLLYANTTTTLAKLPDVATGNALISGGVGVAPAWGKIGLTTHVSGILPTANGGTNLSTYAAGDTLYASAVNTLAKFTKPTAVAIYTMDSSGVPAWKIPRYGAFYDTTNQSAAALTPAAITFNSTQVSSGIAIGSPTSRITVDTAGLYNIQFSIQFYNTVAADDNTVVWLVVNGSNVADSASWVTVPRKHGGGDGQAMMSLNLFYEFTAGQYFQLYWMNTDGNSSLETLPASVTPSYPLSPSIILTVSDNIKA